MGDQQTKRLRGSEPAPQRAEPQVQPATRTAQASYGPAERRQNGCECLRRVVVTTHQHIIFAQGKQHRFHTVSEKRLLLNNNII